MYGIFAKESSAVPILRLSNLISYTEFVCGGLLRTDYTPTSPRWEVRFLDRFLDKVRRFAAIFINRCSAYNHHKSLLRNAQLVSYYAFFTKQAAMLATTRLNGLSCWNILPSGHSTIFELEPVAPMNINYLPAEYCLDRGFPLFDSE